MFDAEGTAEQLLGARRNLRPIDRLTIGTIPKTNDEGYKVQKLQMKKLGTVGGYKAGAAPHGSEQIFAPIPANAIYPSGSRLNSDHYRPGWVEVEFAFRTIVPIIASDPIEKNNLSELVEFTPIIEIIATRFSDILALTTPEIIADLGVNGAIVVGQGTGGVTPPVHTNLRIFVDEKEICPDFMSHGGALDTCLWLVNRNKADGIAMAAGTIITTGTIIKPFAVKGSIQAIFSEDCSVSVELN